MLVYYRDSLTEEEERKAIYDRRYLWGADTLSVGAAQVAYKVRQGGPNNDLVIPRYSIEPFAADMFREFEHAGLVPINSLRQYNWCKDLQNWYEDLEEYTFKTWFSAQNLPTDRPFVVKGVTNSRKDLWDTHMFAANKQEAIKVMCRLQDDTMLSMQQPVFREYKPLKKLAEGPHGKPITAEWRSFYLGRKLLCNGFYWHNYIDDVGPVGNTPEGYTQMIADKIASIHGDRFFYVLDVAQLETGGYILVEVNSGEMSGLACCNPEQLYVNLERELVAQAMKKVSWL